MAGTQDPPGILALAYERATAALDRRIIDEPDVQQRVDLICTNLQNRAVVRLLMACLLAKLHNPQVDVRKPYTEIGDRDAFSGRTYDESYITPFIRRYNLPCNSTTAFLTPALRNRNIVLTPQVNLVGRPPAVYEAALDLLAAVHAASIDPEALLVETVRCLIVLRNQNQERLRTLLVQLQASAGGTALSAEEIVRLVENHAALRGSSRLLVLIVAAAYRVAGAHLGERARPLEQHTAADRRTGALGDLDITLESDDQVITTYEMKQRRVTHDDIDQAVQKLADAGKHQHHYVFITTDAIDPDVQAYAAGMHERTGGIEVVILDCIGFLRHFLHLFHRFRADYLDAYQQLVLAEPESAVGQPLKEAWLTLRRAMESEQADAT